MNQVAVVNDIHKAELRSGGHLAAIIPQDAEQAFRMAQMICQSGMAPKGMESPQKVVAAIFAGLEIGLKPLQAVQSIAVVNGRPCVWGDAAIGLVQGSGLLTGMEEGYDGEGDDMEAYCRLWRAGWEKPIEGRFSVQDAKTACLWTKQGPWKQYPKRMLQMRARSFAIRNGFADVLKGLQIGEEVRDYHTVTGVSVDMPMVNAAAIATQQASGELPPPSDDPASEPVPEIDRAKLEKTARDVATMGSERMREYWPELSAAEQAALKGILPELQRIAAEADGQDTDSQPPAPTSPFETPEETAPAKNATDMPTDSPLDDDYTPPPDRPGNGKNKPASQRDSGETVC